MIIYGNNKKKHSLSHFLSSIFVYSFKRWVINKICSKKVSVIQGMI